jgi:hypothetical protein
MASDPHAFDPYRSPSLPEGPSIGLSPTGRPGLLTTLCVLCIVLGSLGLMNSVVGALGAIGGQILQKTLQPAAGAGMPDDMKKVQEDFQAEIYAVQAKYFWATMPALGFRFVAALLLLIGGIRSLSLVEGGRKMLLAACTVAVVFELVHAILQSVITLGMMTTVNSYVEKLTATMPQGNNGPDMSQIMPMIVRGSIIGGLVFSYIIAVAKIALYVFGLIYLQKPRIRALFRASPTEPVLTPDSRLPLP